jgi:hypothetical protein
MSNVLRTVPAAFISTVLFLTAAAPAKEIRQFDELDDRDQSDYVGLLVEGAQQVLAEKGQTDLAAKVHALFTEVAAGNEISTGMEEFENNLARARVFDAERAAKDPKARRLEVEDAIAVTLKKNGIVLPPSFFSIATNFHPKFPPQSQKNK